MAKGSKTTGSGELREAKALINLDLAQAALIADRLCLSTNPQVRAEALCLMSRIHARKGQRAKSLACLNFACQTTAAHGLNHPELGHIAASVFRQLGMWEQAERVSIRVSLEAATPVARAGGLYLQAAVKADFGNPKRCAREALSLAKEAWQSGPEWLQARCAEICVGVLAEMPETPHAAIRKWALRLSKAFEPNSLEAADRCWLSAIVERRCGNVERSNRLLEQASSIYCREGLGYKLGLVLLELAQNKAQGSSNAISAVDLAARSFSVLKSIGRRSEAAQILHAFHSLAISGQLDTEATQRLRLRYLAVSSPTDQ